MIIPKAFYIWDTKSGDTETFIKRKNAYDALKVAYLGGVKGDYAQYLRITKDIEQFINQHREMAPSSDSFR